MLRKRFEAELARQAAKATKLAAANKLVSSAPSKGRGRKRADRARNANNSSTTNTITTTTTATKGTADVDQALLTGTKPRTGGGGGKKKKRSALANASNPHHLRNYVPSRLPHSDYHSSNNGLSSQANNPNMQNYPSPLPLRFLSADIPPRRRGKKASPSGTAAGPQLTNPAEEWICAFCEYDLFYGDDAEYRRSIKSRKKILKRRKRAREKAAKAASGNSTLKGPQGKTEEGYDDEALWEPRHPVEELPGVPVAKMGRGGGDEGKGGGGGGGEG